MHAHRDTHRHTRHTIVDDLSPIMRRVNIGAAKWAKPCAEEEVESNGIGRE